MAKKFIHVHQQRIRENIHSDVKEPAIIIIERGKRRYAHGVEILDRQGNIVGRLVSSYDKPLSCGARVWFEVEEDIRLIESVQNETSD